MKLNGNFKFLAKRFSLVAAQQPKKYALEAGNITVIGRDTFGDSWNGAYVKIEGTDGTIYLAPWTGPTYHPMGKIQ